MDKKYLLELLDGIDEEKKEEILKYIQNLEVEIIFLNTIINDDDGFF